MRVSEEVTIGKIKKWCPGDCITIKAGTGAGKSYFIKNNLYAQAKKQNKKILMLIHRSNCIEQFKAEIIRDKKTDVIDIKTYQKLEYKELKKLKNDLNDYQYIVCDEFHYFMSDAAFSKTTDISLDLILEQVFAIKIFMSATGDYMKKYLAEEKKIEPISYELDITYDSIKNLSFFYSDETLEKFIEEAIEKNHKAIFFIQSAKKAYELFKKYKDHCLFNCSKNNKDYYKHVDKDKIQNMLTAERFEELILITTTCLDAGTNIVDTDIKHIVCEVEDTGTLIQCIGRKRIQNKDDKFYLYIKSISNKSLGGKITQLNKKISMAKFLNEHTVKEFIEKYQREYDISNMVYDETVTEKNKGTKKVNQLMFFKCKVDLTEIEAILKLGKYGYCKYIRDLFGRKDYRVIEEDYKTNDLDFYLNGIVGKRLLKDGQNELIERIDLKDKRGRIQKSITQFNPYFNENGLLYILKSHTDNIKKLEDGSENPYYRKVYWMIYRLSSETDTENLDYAL